MALANQEERARCGRLGRALVEALEVFIIHDRVRPSDDELSRETGRMALNALLVVGDDLEWLNRVELINGLGEAFGELLGSWPSLRAGFEASFLNGVIAGQAQVAEALTARGRA